MNDQKIYERIGQLLINCGPLDAKKIIVRAELFDEGDGGSYEFDYLNEKGDFNWFDPDGRAVGDLTDLLVELKHYFNMNEMYMGRKRWSECVITLDVERIKIGIKFKYDQ